MGRWRDVRTGRWRDVRTGSSTIRSSTIDDLGHVCCLDGAIFTGLVARCCCVVTPE